MAVNIKILDLKPGMEIARDVKDLHGHLIAPAGVKTSAKLLKVFKIWGVPEVSIKGHSGPDEKEDPLESVNPKRKKEIEGEIKSLFRRNELSHPFIEELMNVCIQRLLKVSPE